MRRGFESSRKRRRRRLWPVANAHLRPVACCMWPVACGLWPFATPTCARMPLLTRLSALALPLFSSPLATFPIQVCAVGRGQHPPARATRRRARAL